MRSFERLFLIRLSVSVGKPIRQDFRCHSVSCVRLRIQGVVLGYPPYRDLSWGREGWYGIGARRRKLYGGLFLYPSIE
jgi:hypothetical protein